MQYNTQSKIIEQNFVQLIDLDLCEQKDELIMTTKQLRNTIDTNIWIYLNPSIKYQTAMNPNNHLPNTNKFIVKLIAMMKDFPTVINWSQDGQQLQIYNVQLFTTEVHPHYFTTTNYKSFLRQLNMYDFRKMSKRKNSISFSHPIFRKGQQHLFQTIKRRKQSHRQLVSNRANFSESLQQSSKQSITELQNPSAGIEIEVKYLLRQVREALEGRADKAFSKIQAQFQRLLILYKNRIDSIGKTTQLDQIQDYLWMPEIENMERESRQVFSESGYEYNQQVDIFKEG